MKVNMFVSFALLVSLVGTAFSQPVSVRVRVAFVDTCCYNPQDHYEWLATLVAELFDANGEYVLPSSSYNYLWYKDECRGVGWFLMPTSGYGAYSTNMDGQLVSSTPGCCGLSFDSWHMYVSVETGSEVLTSSIVGVPDDGTCVLQQTRPIQIDQRSETVGTFGSVGLFVYGPLNDGENDRFYYYPAPFTFGFREYATQTLKASQNALIVPLQKYREWDGFSDVKNHHPFYVDRSFSSLTGMFRSVDASVIIKTDLIDSPGTTGGSIQFHDPWYIDFQDGQYGNNWRNRGMQEPRQFHGRSVGSTGWQPDFTTIYPAQGPYPYNGVFLNQVPDPQNPNKPYYSVGASNPNTINGFESYFMNWAGDPNYVSYQNATTQQTGVVFKLSGATATARYKAHLGSSLTSATGSNSQRKLVSHDGDRLYLAYESANEVWVTISTDQGVSWNQEKQVSDGLARSSSPSLAVAGFTLASPSLISDELYVIYRSVHSPTVPFYDFYMRKQTNGVWVQPEQINEPQNAVMLEVDPHPVVSRHNTTSYAPELVAVWEGWAGPPITRTLKWSYSQVTEGGWGPWTDGLEISSTDYTHRNPSLSSAVDWGEPRPLYLTYDNGDDVFWRTYVDPSSPWSLPVYPVPASVDPISYASQVAADTRNENNQVVHVVWEAVGAMESEGDGGSMGLSGAPPPQHSVMYQGKVGAAWTGAHQFVSAIGTDYFRPSIANLASGNLVMAWDIGPLTYRATYDGVSWSAAAISATGAYANLAGSGTSGPTSTTKYVATTNMGPPYKLRMSPETFSSPTGDIDTLSEIYSRQVVVGYQGVNGGNSPERDGSPGRRASSFAIELRKPTLKLNTGAVVQLEFIPVADTLPGFNETSAWEHLASVPVTLTGSMDSIILEGRVKGSSLGDLTNGVGINLSFDVVDAQNGRVIRRLGPSHFFQRDTARTLRIRGALNTLVGRSVFICPSLDGILRGRSDFVYALVHVHTLLDDSTLSHPLAPLSKLTTRIETVLPTSFALHQNYPNPFNPTTEIRFDLPDAGNVSLVVYDVLGREVAELENGHREAGYHSTTWNASAQASGVYFVRFSVINAEGLPAGQAGKMAYSKVTKLMLIR